MSGFVAAALEGDFVHRLPELVVACGRRPVGKARHFTKWASAAPFVERTNHLAAAVSGEWTVLVDDWNLTNYLFDTPSVTAELAKRYRTRVVTAYGQSVSGSCGYRVHNRGGARSRSVLVWPDGVLEDLGKPLPGEDTTDLELHDTYSVLDILNLIGLDVADGVEATTRCAVIRHAPAAKKSSIKQVTLA